MSQTFSPGYALFVGVGNTSYPSWSLPVTVKDAQALVTTFTNANLCAYPDNDQHIQFLHDASATRQAIIDRLNWLKDQATADPEATIVVYYSGHGWLDRSTGSYYLIPHDVKPQNVLQSALSAQTLIEAWHAIQVGYSVKKYAERAKLVDVSPHDLRHRFRCRMAESVALHRLAQIMGHDSLDTTRLSIQGTKLDLQQAVETIAWT
jgi:hypothetical protein